MKLIIENWKRFLTENVSYSAVVIDEESKAKLMKAAQEIGIPEGFVHQTKAGKPLPHHMTIKMGGLFHKKPSKDYSQIYDVGEVVKMKVVSIGLDENAMAAEVELPEGKKSKNKIPHVTIAIPEGGKPFLSNKIPMENWQSITPFEISGTVKEV